MKYWNIIKAQFFVSIDEVKTYKMNFFSQILVFGIILLVILFTSSGHELANYYSHKGDSKELILIGYIFWIFSTSAINSTSAMVTHGSSDGTLEQKLMAIVPFQFLVLVEIIEDFVFEVIEAIIICFIAYLITGTAIHLSIYSIIALIVVMIGMYGIGLIFGGISLKEKRIGNLIFLCQILLLFVSNTFGQMFQNNIFDNILPISIGIDIARKASSNMEITLMQWSNLVICSTLWLGLGLIIFQKYLIKTKKEGLTAIY